MPIKSRYARNVTKSLTDTFQILKKYGGASTINILGNECFHDMKMVFESEEVNYSLVCPPCTQKKYHRTRHQDV